jgi:hypothetical protein
MGWLGLNTTSAGMPAELGINPVVGIRHAKLETALLELVSGLPRPPIPSATKPLGYLMPENKFRTWSFLDGESAAVVAADMASAVSVYGQRFIDTYSDWGVYSATIEESGMIPDHQRAIFYPIIAIINGETARAESLVRDELVRVGEKSDMYSTSYRDFAHKFTNKYLG